MVEFKGLFPAIFTPFMKNEEIDEAGMRKNVDMLISNGVDGLVVAGGAGECPHLSDEEYKRVVDVVIDQANGRVPIIATSSAVATRHVVEKTRYAEDAGAAGAMILPPYYYGLTEEEILQHYKEVAASVDFPIIVYNNPGASKKDLSPELLVKIFEETGNVKYVKNTMADVTRVHRIVRLSDNKMTVFVGIENNALESFVVGAKGWINASGNIATKKMSEITTLAVEKGDFLKAKRLYFELLPLLTYIEIGCGNRWLPRAKAAMDMIGGVGGYPRRPFLPATEQEKAEVKNILKKVGLLT